MVSSVILLLKFNKHVGFHVIDAFKFGLIS